MSKRKRSLDDVCDIFLSRRRVRSPSTRAASELPHHAPALRPENLAPPFILIPRPLEFPEPSTTALSVPSKKPLPLPGSSGPVQAKPARLANGRQHVPRPRNPFILFRCDLVHQRKILPRSDLDDTNISRIAGDIWREMTPAQKKPWVDLAAQEKARHALLYPDYKYAPSHGGSKGKKTKSDVACLDDRSPLQVSQIGAASPSDRSSPSRQAERPGTYLQSMPHRRTSSCPPPGAVPVPSHPTLDRWTPPLTAQDSIQRRPSRVIMYQSVASQSNADPAALMPTDYNPSIPQQDFDWLNDMPQIDPSLLDAAFALPNLNQIPGPYASPNFNFFDYKPTFSGDACDPGFTAQELADMERLVMGSTFSDPFSSLSGALGDGIPFTLPAAIPPFDCSRYSTGSPSTPSSGTLSN